MVYSIVSMLWVGGYLLVTRHHEKLYSPSDYRVEQNFIKSYNSTTRKDEIKNSNEQNMECELDQMDEAALKYRIIFRRASNKKY